MKKNISPSALARDDRFSRIDTDRHTGDRRDTVVVGHVDPEADDVSERARRKMHSILVGEIQALEGAGRTAFDFGTDEVPYELKLDMARQCWDEARHCEISVKLAEHMGAELGEYAEATTLFEAACHEDPMSRLAGVNRVLEGLATDVFTQMRDFAQTMNDPVLEYAGDFMLADELTHVKMGSRWIRQLTENDPKRRARALDFQQPSP
ncbi:MAG: ferritin-like domain-containing protein [Actinomycetia bacterium]|nr:ferritin-like domain-containing protein [Actinomycetes bacterium]MCP5030198.1 ferritin-like domain-containing protein [Actinomycetes bacterium]